MLYTKVEVCGVGGAVLSGREEEGGRVVRFSVRFSAGRLDADGAACSADLAAGILL